MTALSIVQAVTTELGLSSPSAVFSSTDQQIIQLRNLLNREGKLLAREHAWTKLITEKTFTTVAAALQTDSVATDFGWYINGTMWNRTTDIKFVGPISPEGWQREQALPSVSIITPAFRFKAGSVYLTPTPTASQTVAYEYVSNKWAETSLAVGLAAMTADTDVAKLDEELITLGVIWRFKKAKGLEYGEDFRTYEIEKAKAMARDGGARTYSLHGESVPFVGGPSITEGSWGL